MLNKTGRRWLRVIHIAFIGTLLGGLLSMLMLYLMPVKGADAQYAVSLTIFMLFNSVVTYAFYGVIATALVYSTFTHWGLTKHWWVIGKWVGTLLLFALVWIWIGPAISSMVALTDAGRDQPMDVASYVHWTKAFVPTVIISVSIICILIAITIFRPWGPRKQKLELSRRTILSSVGAVVVLSVAMTLFAARDMASYRQMKISTPDLSILEDGRYEGESTYAGFTYKVQVTLLQGRIAAVEILENRESPYAVFAESIVPRVIRSQSPDVDGITGATTTSKCLMKAIENALERNQ